MRSQERYHIVEIMGFELVLHRFVASDPDRGFHDHPWLAGWSLILAGSYDELLVDAADSPVNERRRVRRQAITCNCINPRTFHRVLVEPGEDAWTLFLMAPRTKTWGFLAREGGHQYDKKPATKEEYHDRPGKAQANCDVASDPAASAQWDTAEDRNFSSTRLSFRQFSR